MAQGGKDIMRENLQFSPSSILHEERKQERFLRLKKIFSVNSQV